MLISSVMSHSAFPFGHFSVAHYHGMQVYKVINLFEEKSYDTARRGVRHLNNPEMAAQKKMRLLTYHFLTREKPGS